jgi:hypothetical protein
MPRRITLIAAAFAAILLAPAGVFAGVSAADYRASLLEILGKYQGVLALNDACSSAFPQTRAANDKAFAAWHGRHKRLEAELDQRFAMMVRAYSRDEKEYSRNFGKYQGAILRQREDTKQTLLLETRGDLETRCKAMPEFLRSRESDLEAEFANDLMILRQWPLTGK